MSSDVLPALAVHGGAWAIPDGEVEAHLDAMRRAVAEGSRMLLAGAGAVEAVVAVIEVLEDHPALDAAVGAVLNRAGEVELDAGIMDGATRDFGAVAGARRIRHPIAAAERLLRRGDRQCSMLVGPRADEWAAGEGLLVVDPAEFVLEREVRRFEVLRERERRFHTSQAFRGGGGPQGIPGERNPEDVHGERGDTIAPEDIHGERGPQDTVGCVALDRLGRLAAGTSTGGAPYTIPGRVGDSPLPGCGFYASPAAAASATGWGEAIARVLMCGAAVDEIERGMAPQDAAAAAVRRLSDLVRDPEGQGATGGIILVDREGRIGMEFNTPRMARAAWSPSGESFVRC